MNTLKRILGLIAHNLIVHIIIHMCGIPRSTLTRHDTSNGANCRTHNSCMLSTRTKGSLQVIKICKLLLVLSFCSNKNEIESDPTQLESLINASAMLWTHNFTRTTSKAGYITLLPTALCKPGNVILDTNTDICIYTVITWSMTHTGQWHKPIFWTQIWINSFNFFFSIFVEYIYVVIKNS
jgi:hypothetical protein